MLNVHRNHKAYKGRWVKGRLYTYHYIVTGLQELCESRGGCPGLSVLMNLTVSLWT